MSLVTGSRVYGTPRYNSDIDLVVLLTSEELKIFESFEEKSDNVVSNSENDKIGKSLSVKYGKLNLIITTDKKVYKAWKKATEELIAKKPVTRGDAIRLVKEKLTAIKEQSD